MTGDALVVVDMQHVFADPASPWNTPDYAAAAAGVRRLLPAFTGVTVWTRFVAPERPEGAWRAYYDEWPFALVPDEDPIWLIDPALGPASDPVVSAPTFGKWGDALASALGGAERLVVVGVSTDCCVLSTALAAADAGRAVVVAADACAGASAADHERALAAMALYTPLITISSVDEVVGRR
ncbi:isochorismatase family protein [Amnibacterium sp.]|uniref:cysteine hydrolase family protein n=1 Tax=Amnibacterium sp. TaxID=1872496 RepID=UPI002619C3A7|nr:isochorismatase family protein [Amnibacterium sp.]MCU1472732.1 isochorismatase hydrolase [Amnibacterium sp.]